MNLSSTKLVDYTLTLNGTVFGEQASSTFVPFFLAKHRPAALKRAQKNTGLRRAEGEESERYASGLALIFTYTIKSGSPQNPANLAYPVKNPRQSVANNKLMYDLTNPGNRL